MTKTKYSWSGASVLLLAWVANSQGEECNNLCRGLEEDWCGKRRWGEEGQVLRCADRTRHGYQCYHPCENGKCSMGNVGNDQVEYCGTTGPQNTNWTYGPYGQTIGGYGGLKKCLTPCEKQGEDYWWCYTQENKANWNSCSPPSEVIEVRFAKNGQECVGSCGQWQGEKYWWCRKSVRYKYRGGAGGSRTTDAWWDYCSPDHKHTRYNVPCTSECQSLGESYFWCYTKTGWDYCGPKVDNLVGNGPWSLATSLCANHLIYASIPTLTLIRNHLF